MIPLWRGDCIDIDVVDIIKDALVRVWFQVKSSPNTAEIDRISTVFTTYIRNSGHKIILHIQHCHSPELRIPEISEMLTIVGRLLECRDLIDQKLCGTIVQALCVNTQVVFAKDLFLSMYVPKRPFDIVDNDDDATTFMKTLVPNVPKKKA